MNAQERMRRKFQWMLDPDSDFKLEEQLALETKLRRVRTPEGQRLYDQPIGSLIRPGMSIPHASPLKVDIPQLVNRLIAQNPRQDDESEFEWQSRCVGKLPPALKDEVLWRIREEYDPCNYIAEGARRWRQEHGLPEPRVDILSQRANPLKADRVARAFEETEDQSDDPEVQVAFDDFKRQNREMYDFMTADPPVGLGVTVTFVTPEEGGFVPGTGPYKSARQQAEDLRVNRHISIESGLGGAHEATMTVEEYDLFRAVHDVFGHAAIGGGFDRHGEYQAWLAHMTMYTGEGARAMSSEYHGVNSALWAGQPGSPGTGRSILLPDELIRDPWDEHGDLIRKAERDALDRLIDHLGLDQEFAAAYEVGPLHRQFVRLPKLDLLSHKRLVEWAETKGVRKVATPEGARYYGLPIGTPIGKSGRREVEVRNGMRIFIPKGDPQPPSGARVFVGGKPVQIRGEQVYLEDLPFKLYSVGPVQVNAAPGDEIGEHNATPLKVGRSTQRLRFYGSQKRAFQEMADLKLAAEVHGAPTAGSVTLRSRAIEEAWHYEPRPAWASPGTIPDFRELMYDYFNQRLKATGRFVPEFVHEPEWDDVRWADFNPADVGIMEVPRTNLGTGALITRERHGAGGAFLVYGDVSHAGTRRLEENEVSGVATYSELYDLLYDDPPGEDVGGLIDPGSAKSEVASLIEKRMPEEDEFTLRLLDLGGYMSRTGVDVDRVVADEYFPDGGPLILDRPQDKLGEETRLSEHPDANAALSGDGVWARTGVENDWNGGWEYLGRMDDADVGKLRKRLRGGNRDAHGLVPEVRRGDDSELRQMLRQGAVADMVHTWAQSSNDEHARSLAIQDKAVEVFELDPEKVAPWNTMPYTTLEKDQILSRDSDVIEAFLLAQYEITQEKLKKARISALRLFRGFKDDFGEVEEIPDWWEEDEAAVKLRPLSAFSMDSWTAIDFASDGGDDGRMIVGTVPADQILSFSRSGFGSLDEGEFVVIGGHDIPFIVEPAE